MGDASESDRSHDPPLSDRVKQNLIPNKLGEVRKYVYDKQYDPVTNPAGIVALAIAENKLMRDEMTEHINAHFKITPWHLTYGEGPVGTTPLREHLASYINDVFHPHLPISKDDICMCNGAGNAVNNFAFCVGEPGDGILLSQPLYTGFYSDIQAQSKVQLVPVPMGGGGSGGSGGTTDPLSVEAVQHYERALLQASSSGTKIRAILLANPHNPLGRPYPQETLIALLQLCQTHNIHLLSDEVYAQTRFPSPDFPSHPPPPPPPFTSILSIDVRQHINPALVHVVYALSKDFCANGVRIGCFVSPFNPPFLSAFTSLAGFTRPSQLSEHVWLNLLRDRQFLDRYFPEMRRRLADAYAYTTGRLKGFGIPYSPACCGPCVWVDMSEFLGDDPSEEGELALNWRLAKAKVWIAMGATFGAERSGWYRITFATPREELCLGLDRCFEVLGEVRRERGG